MRNRRISLFLFSCVVIAALAWAIGGLTFIRTMNAYIPPDMKSKTDAIIVLTGGPGRINAGFDLLQDHLGKKMLISGVDKRVTTQQLVSMWKNNAATPCCVTLGRKAQNTAQNAAEAAEWIAHHDIQSVRLVTADYHMTRAILELEHLAPHISIIPYAVKTSDNRIKWLLSFTEYNKTLLTRAKTGLTP